jgi:PAS domain S-box-containing protein
MFTLEGADQACRVIVEAMSEGALIVAADGTILYCNRRFAALLNMPPEKVVGSPLRDFLHAKDRAVAKEMLEGGEATIKKEALLVTGAGDVPVQLSAGSLTVDEAAVVCIVVADLTDEKRERHRLEEEVAERRRTEEQLRASEHFIRQVVDTNPGIIGIYDVIEDQLVYANRRLAELLGLPAGDVKGPGKELFRKAAAKGGFSLQWVKEQFARSGANDTIEYEMTLKGGDGRPRVFRSRDTVFDRDAGGRVRLVLGVGRDVTEEKQLDEERKRLAAVVEQAAEGVLLIDPKGIIRYANPAFAAMSGWGREELVGRHPRILRGDTHSVIFYRNLVAAARQGRVWSGRMRNKKKDGSLYDVEMTISPMRSADGQVVSYIAIAKDVTREMQLEERLRQAQKMEAVGTLAGGIAHDFNNMLASIIGFADLARDEVPEGSPARRFVEQIYKAGLKGRELIKQMLTFARQTGQEKKQVPIGPLIMEGLKVLRASIPSTVDIGFHAGSESVSVLGDETQIRQVFMNLCANAGHAMREKGGLLEIGLSSIVLQSPEEIHPDLRPGAYVRLTVRDTGVGIRPEVLGRIFDPFFTTKKPGEGTGMGLSVALGIVQGHSGAITVNSKAGEGSIFTVYLPAIEPQAEGEARGQDIPGGRERVLLIDDERDVAETIRLILEGLGYHVTAKTSGPEALEAFLDGPEDFDLVITDQTMPQITGVELARKMLSIRPDLPVLLCTGFSQAVDTAEAHATGIRECLMKPVIRRDMALAIRRALEAVH